MNILFEHLNMKAKRRAMDYFTNESIQLNRHQKVVFTLLACGKIQKSEKFGAEKISTDNLNITFCSILANP